MIAPRQAASPGRPGPIQQAIAAEHVQGAERRCTLLARMQQAGQGLGLAAHGVQSFA